MRIVALLLLIIPFQLLSQPDLKIDETLVSQFTKESLVIDGKYEQAWDNAKAYPVKKAMLRDLSAPAAA